MNPTPIDHPDFPSGDWAGFYQQGSSKFRMDLRLSFRANVISGAGADSIGQFSVRGRYDPESREVTFSKRYQGAHDVYYRGYRETRGIWGVWEIGTFQRSGFHIWPRGEGENESAAAEATAEEPIGFQRMVKQQAPNLVGV